VEALRELLCSVDADGEVGALTPLLRKPEHGRSGDASEAPAVWEEWYEAGRDAMGEVVAAPRVGPPPQGDAFDHTWARWVAALQSGERRVDAWLAPAPAAASGHVGDDHRCGRVPLACGGDAIAPSLTGRLRLCGACKGSHARLLFHLLLGEAMVY